MATRLYYDYNIGPPFTVAVDAAWDVTASTLRIRLVTAKGDPGAALATFGNGASTGNSPAGASDVLIGRAISEPIAADVTISGAIKGYMRTLESNAAADMRSQMVVRIVQPDGTVRGTLIAADASALTSEWTTALTNRKMPLNSPVTPVSVNAIAGDRIVVEFGYRKHENAATSRSGSVSLGSPAGTDIAENETATTANVPWIEFADTITFVTGAMFTQVGADTVISPTSQKARFTQIGAEAVFSLIPPVDSDLVIDPHINGLVHKDLVPSYQITQLATKNLAIAYAVQQDFPNVGTDLGIDYRILPDLANVGKNLDFHYRVTKATARRQVGADLKLKNKIVQNTVVGKNLGLTYQVLPVVTVGVDLPFQFDAQINASVGLDLDFTDEVEVSRPRGDVTFAYAVSQPTPNAELTFTPAVRNAVGKNLGIDWALGDAVAKNLPFDAVVRNAVGSSLSVDAILRDAVGASLSLDRAIRNTVGGERGLDFIVFGTPRSDLTIDATIEGQVDTADHGDGPGRRYVIVESRQKPQVFTAGSNLVIDHRIEEPVGADMALASAIRVLASVDIEQTYAVHTLVTQKHVLDHKIVDFYDTNRGILLSEIDDDLALTA